MAYNTAGFENQLHNMDVELSEVQLKQFLTYYEMLVEKNKVMNLTAITDFDEVVEKHFVDSLSLIRVMDLHRPISIMDLGTGAGFPGIPLKIAFPNLHITLADSLHKRIVFLQEVIEALDLENIRAVHGRAEDLAKNSDYREKYDACVSRAVANLSTLAEYCLPFVKIGGRFISYKAGACEEEVASAKSSIFLLGGKLVKVEKFLLGDAGRSLVVIEKKEGTPKMYPRKAGTPSKNPL
jgi:16S rRNA (guanine527-N7)-methyltransferase